MSQFRAAFYAASIEQFLRDARGNDDVTTQLVTAYTQYYDAPPSDEQIGAWSSAVKKLRYYLRCDGLAHAVIALEFPVDGNGRRADVVLCGRDAERGYPHVAILELKTWHTRKRKDRRYDFRACNTDGGRQLLVNLYTINGGVATRLSSTIEQDPRHQVDGYRRCIVEQFERALARRVDDRLVSAGVLLYNVVHFPKTLRAAFDLVIPPDDAIAVRTPIYTGHGHNKTRSLTALQEEWVSRFAAGRGDEVYEKLCSVMSLV